MQNISLRWSGKPWLESKASTAPERWPGLRAALSTAFRPHIPRNGQKELPKTKSKQTNKHIQKNPKHTTKMYTYTWSSKKSKILSIFVLLLFNWKYCIYSSFMEHLTPKFYSFPHLQMFAYILNLKISEWKKKIRKSLPLICLFLFNLKWKRSFTIKNTGDILMQGNESKWEHLTLNISKV